VHAERPAFGGKRFEPREVVRTTVPAYWRRPLAAAIAEVVAENAAKRRAEGQRARKTREFTLADFGETSNTVKPPSPISA